MWGALIKDGGSSNPSILRRIEDITNAANNGTLSQQGALERALMKSIDRIHRGFPELNTDQLPIPPPLTLSQRRRLPNITAQNFWFATGSKGCMRKISKIDAERFFQAEFNAAASVTHQEFLKSRRNGRSGASLHANGVGRSQMSDDAFKMKAARHLGVPLQPIYRILDIADVDRADYAKEIF